MTAHGYLALPWLIGTYPQWTDGGAQLSVHMYAFGPGVQLIQLYHELTAVEERTFLPVCPAQHGPAAAHARHGRAMDLDGRCWDLHLQHTPEQFSIVPETISLRDGQTIVLPAGRAHVFKKHGSGWQLGLMFSIAGDESYVAPLHCHLCIIS